MKVITKNNLKKDFFKRPEKSSRSKVGNSGSSNGGGGRPLRTAPGSNSWILAGGYWDVYGFWNDTSEWLPDFPWQDDHNWNDRRIWSE